MYRVDAAIPSPLPLILLLSACSTPPPAPAAVVLIEPPPPRVQVQPPRPSREELVDAILTRSLFDSEKVGLDAEEARDDEEQGLTDLPLRLLGTVMAEPVTLSSALIAIVDEDGQTIRTRGYGIGAEILEGARLARITARRVYLEREDGALERLDIVPTGPGEVRDVPRKALRAAVKRAGRDQFTLDDDVFASASADSLIMGTRLRANPDEDVGGVQVVTAASSTPLYHMGLRRRDVVRRVNGEAVSTRGELKAALRDAVAGEHRFTIEITRSRRERALTYSLR